MPKVKICGLKRLEDIEIVNKYHPDYVGFVFSNSKRQVDFKTAKILKQNLNKNIKSVGVFVNEKIEYIVELCKNQIIDLIQLHGDEDNNYLSNIKNILKNPIIKSVSVGENFKIPNIDADYLLFDTYKENAKGGTGEVFNWNKLMSFNDKPFFLAGGLNSKNVNIAITKTKPFCVDVSSGVEKDGFKDEYLIEEFIKKTRNS
jgi:phosphoribosylanthranilate isomerase